MDEGEVATLLRQASISFRATGANLSFRTGVEEYDRREVRLAYSLELQFPERLKLGTGESVEKEEIKIRLSIGTGPQAGQYIGTMDYFGGHEDDIGSVPPGIGIDISLPEKQSATLIDLAKRGLCPEEIHLRVSGLTYDWQPDGSGKEWDNKAHPRCFVTSASFALPVAGADIENAAEEANRADRLPVRRAEIGAITAKQEELSQGLTATRQRVGELLLLAVIVVIVWLWQRYFG